METFLDEKIAFFKNELLSWKEAHPRPLPWQDTQNPYYIWLSEIILQQTRVEQGMPYYERFIRQFPSIERLAEASEDEVMKQWEGLGYYSRARNMHATAKYIHLQLGGVFPETFEGLIALKGIGPYTAAAIASFAYDLPHAVVDGNVFRVLARYFGQATPIDSTAGKKLFTELANQVLDSKQPGHFNQAMMDFGATWCTPKQPKCMVCALAPHCSAYKNGDVERLPVKEKSLKKRTRYFHYLIIQYDGGVLLQKREGKDIWQNLYEFPLIETASPSFEWDELQQTPLWHELNLERAAAKLLDRSASFTQILSHQKIIACFWKLHPTMAETLNLNGSIHVETKNLTKFAFPKIIGNYLKFLENNSQIPLF